MQHTLLELDTERRNRMLKAALHEFAENGYEKASTNRISKEAGLSKPLMFHYIKSKQELFTFTSRYFHDLLMKEYYAQLPYDETDLLERLQASFLLQLNLLEQFPWIFDFMKLPAIPQEDGEAAKQDEMKKAACQLLESSYDTAKFKPELKQKECIPILLMACRGFGDSLLEELKSDDAIPKTAEIEKRIRTFFQGLKQVFYHPAEEV